MSIIGHYVLDQNRLYITKEGGYSTIKLEMDSPILSSILNDNQITETEFYKSLTDIYCKCPLRSRFDIKSATKAPSRTILDHTDLFSCHKNEFDPILKQKLSPRKDGILWDVLHFTIHENNIPKCCSHKYKNYDTGNIKKIFANEVHFNANELKIKSDEGVIEAIFYYLFQDIFRGCRVINIGKMRISKLVDVYVLVDDLREDSEISTTKYHNFSPKTQICPAIHLSFERTDKKFELENVEWNNRTLEILNNILERNQMNQKSNLGNLTFLVSPRFFIKN